MRPQSKNSSAGRPCEWGRVFKNSLRNMRNDFFGGNRNECDWEAVSWAGKSTALFPPKCETGGKQNA